MNNKDIILEQLRLLGLGHYESRIYLELLEGPSSHLKLAHATGINRTKVYRLAEELEKRSLITRRTDDRGTFLVAADPATLEVSLVTAEEILKQQREALTQLMPALSSLQQGAGRAFSISTYEGIDGFKQMLWHELKTAGECLIFGSGTLESLIPDRHWAEKHRAMTLEAGYSIREILNPGGKPADFTDHAGYHAIYHRRHLSAEILPLDLQVVVYNDTVATYHWRNEQKVGYEVVSPTYAEMMRAVFEQFWHIAK